MRGIQRARWVVGAATFAMIATACGGSDGGGGSSAGQSASGSATGGAAAGGGQTGKITIHSSEPENTLVPANTNETGGGRVVDALFTGLVVYNPDTAAAENAMAESITASPDNMKYTVKLKPGYKFHDGTDVKAKNYVDAWNWGAYGPNANLSSYFFEPIAGYTELNPEDPDGETGPKKAPAPPTDKMSGLRVVDDTTFEATMASPVSNFAQRLGYTAFSPLPDSFFADPKAFGEKPIGNGPFKFVKWDKNVGIDATAFESYTGPDKPKIKDITFKSYQDSDSAYVDLQGDNLDFHEQLPASALAGDKYKSDLQDRGVDRVTGVIQTLAIPNYLKDYNRPDLRRAISMAIDRPLITQQIFNNGREPASGWVSPAVDGFKAGAAGEYTTFDPAKAKAALAKAGGFTGTLTISYNSDGAHKEWVDAACNSIKNAIGVNCQGKPYVDFATLRKDVNANKMTGMFRTGWQMDYPSIENFLGPLYATDAGSNDTGYSNPAFDAKLKEAAAAQGAESITKYQEAEALLANDLPVIPLWYQRAQAGYSTKVDNVKVTPFGELDLSSVTVK